MLTQHQEILTDLNAAKAKVLALRKKSGLDLDRVLGPVKTAIKAVEDRIDFYKEQAPKAPPPKPKPAPKPIATPPAES